MTHSFATLEVTKSTFEDVQERLSAAGVLGEYLRDGKLVLGTIALTLPKRQAPSEPAECCPDWKAQTDKINGFITLQAVRSGNSNIYDGVPFRFCPWCGKAR